MNIRKESERDPKFAEWIGSFAENIRQCIHCGQCSSSCPLSGHMDMSPRRLMHLAREGFKKDVLESFSLWLCTSCYACLVKCPHEIKVTDVMYALKRKAMEEGKYPKRFAIPVLANEFRKMVLKNGRISEGMLAAMMMLKTNPLRLFGMAKLGMGLMRTGRFSMLPEKSKHPEKVRALMAEVEKEQRRAPIKEVVA